MSDESDVTTHTHEILGPVDEGTLCSFCGTDTREGSHGKATQDGDHVRFQCCVPIVSRLPRRVQFVTVNGIAELWYRGHV